MKKEINTLPGMGLLFLYGFSPRLLESFSPQSTWLMIGISTSLMIALQWFRNTKARKTLEQERLSSELSLLKNQIKPHFFFNTLNSIYALTEANPEAQEAIYRLSKLMRYMLYETEHDQVLLSKEIDFVNNYVELMRLRLANTVAVQFSHPSNMGTLTITPLIFVTFIENAFKHGVSYDQPSYVKAELRIVEQWLHFTVRNPLIHMAKATNLESSGIGLVNVRRRLNLLYPDRHQLTICTHQEEYVVHLTIQLS